MQVKKLPTGKKIYIGIFAISRVTVIGVWYHLKIDYIFFSFLGLDRIILIWVLCFFFKAPTLSSVVKRDPSKDIFPYTQEMYLPEVGVCFRFLCIQDWFMAGH